MDELELKAVGQNFRIGEDLYGVSVTQLNVRVDILKAELARIDLAIHKKNEELTMAEAFFKKT